MRVSILQMCSTDDPSENAKTLVDAVAQAASEGAQLVLTPEVSNCVSASRTRQEAVLHTEAEDQTLAAVRAAARAHGVWVMLGSLALKTGDPDGRFANRCLLIDDQGDVQARYDKIHMFDVILSDSEQYHESKGYRPGDRAVIGQTPWATLGMTICYDLRFPQLFRDLAQAGAQVLTVPSAFAMATGQAHWETLLRARAIETGCFVLAPAQSGLHGATRGKSRETWGHSMVVAPWGEVLLDMGQKVGLATLDLDLAKGDTARRRVPSLSHDRPYRAPKV